MAVKALVFDLDGTLADSTYQHVVAWQRAFKRGGIEVAALEIHRRIGMDGDLMLQALDRAFALGLDARKRAALKAGHAEAFSTMRDDVRLFPKAETIGATLQSLGISWAIVTSGTKDDVGGLLQQLNVESAGAVITGEDQKESKPSGHPIAQAFEALGVKPHDAGVVGDSVWDMLASREAGSFGIGVLTGGYAREELASSGAFRVYRDVAEFLTRLEEVGIQSKT